MTYLIVPALTTLALSTFLLTAQQTLYSFDGDSPGDLFGSSVSGAGDVDGDGYADLIVGASADDKKGWYYGSARVLSGQDGSILYTFYGNSMFDHFGVSVSGAGDVNGDGYSDVIVGAHQSLVTTQRPGYARVFSGRDGSIIHTFIGDSIGHSLGSSVSGAGDVNGDGYADLIVTANGLARVFSGRNGSVLYTFRPGGTAVSGAGDVNGDGYADLIVGDAVYSSSNLLPLSGRARVFSGSDGAILYSFDGNSQFGFFGFSVGGAGDVNGDGYCDVIAGSRPLVGTNRPGYARVFSGRDGSSLYTFIGDSAGDEFGGSVSGAGDVNGDGYADLIVGAGMDDNNGISSGSARVFSGLDGSILHTLYGDSTDDFLGSSVSGAGDVNGDGYANLIVGAFRDDNNGSESGMARVFSLGLTGSPTRHRYYGDGCEGSNGHLPRITIDGRAALGHSFALDLTGAVPAASTFMMIGSPMTPLNLGFIGYPSCTAFVSSFDTFASTADAQGFAYTPVIAVPNQLALIGARLDGQWVVVDSANGVAASNASIVIVGT